MRSKVPKEIFSTNITFFLCWYFNKIAYSPYSRCLYKIEHRPWPDNVTAF